MMNRRWQIGGSYNDALEEREEKAAGKEMKGTPQTCRIE